jgi:adenosine deaminase
VSRSEISVEFLRAAVDQGLDYSQLKRMARTSLTYSFINGDSLWADAGRPVRECSGDILGGQSPSAACGSFLASNEKARLQWKLEEQFKKFEAGF